MDHTSPGFALFYVSFLAGLLIISGCRSPRSGASPLRESVESTGILNEDTRPASSSGASSRGHLPAALSASKEENSAAYDSSWSAAVSKPDTIKDELQASQMDPAGVDCPVGPEKGVVSITLDSSGYETKAAVEPLRHTYRGKELWSATVKTWLLEDVNRDGRLDVGPAVNCDRAGCDFSLYLACGGNRYVPVMRMISAYDFEPFPPNSTKWSKGTGYTPKAFAEAERGQKWRQFMKIPNLDVRKGTRHYPTLIYRFYDKMERYALLPGSGWFAHHEAPYTKSEMREAGTFPPNCPAGRRAPTILDSTMETQTVWRGDLNNDQKVDRILRADSVGETGPTQHEFTVYAKCNGTWYTRVHRQRYAVELTPTEDYTAAPNGSRWRNLHIRFHEPGETEVRSRTIRFKHAAYEEGLP